MTTQPDVDPWAERIAELRELEAAATPGPWKALADGYGDTSGGTAHEDRRDLFWIRAGKDNSCDIVTTYGEWKPQSEHDIAFIAAVRNALPALLAALAEKDEAIDVNAGEAAIFKALLDEARAALAEREAENRAHEQAAMHYRDLWERSIAAASNAEAALVEAQREAATAKAAFDHQRSIMRREHLPFADVLDRAESAEAEVREAGERIAQAWDEGVAAGRSTDVAAQTQPPNPYRTGGDA